MEIEVTDATGLPAWLQSHVADGKLDLTKLPEPEDVTGLKTALQKERENVAAYAKLGSPDEIQSTLSDLREKAKGTGKGAEEAQAKLDALEEKYRGDLSARDQRIEKLMKSSATGALKGELGKVGFIPEAIDDVAASALARVAFDDDGNMKITTADGKPMLGTGEGHNATLADLAKELAEAKSYAVRDPGKGGGGKPPGTNGGKPGYGDNPWKPETRNLTRQAEILKSDPQRAQALRAEAGIK